MKDYKNYQKILVPSDGSELSESVLPEVERLASALEVSILVLKVAYIHFVLGTDPLVQETKEAKVVSVEAKTTYSLVSIIESRLLSFNKTSRKILR